MDDSDFEQLIEEYCHILAPLFDGHGDPFDYVLALLRAAGQENAGWDTLEESFRMLDDLHYLSTAHLPQELFPEPKTTRLRLELLQYCHLVEMAAPYDIIANLCRVRLGQPVSYSLFIRPKNKGATNKLGNQRQFMSPTDKINIIKSLSRSAELPAIGDAFDEFYRSGIRNAIDHSDYVIHDGEFRMRNQTIKSDEDSNVRTSVIKLARLQEFVSRTRAFYLAFIRVEKGARLTVGQRRGNAFPYDHHYKGILEAVADKEDFLCGAVVHWPNETESYYMRTANGSKPMNVLPLNGELTTFVGEKYSPHDPFSPLVKLGDLPRYT
ncbi:MAG: hypothetical protein SH868_16880, partial [Bythopirellula sp.]|nr:hypothetical protein [Bythopirellula sp.]